MTGGEEECSPPPSSPHTQPTAPRSKNNFNLCSCEGRPPKAGDVWLEGRLKGVQGLGVQGYGVYGSMCLGVCVWGVWVCVCLSLGVCVVCVCLSGCVSVCMSGCVCVCLSGCVPMTILYGIPRCVVVVCCCVVLYNKHHFNVVFPEMHFAPKKKWHPRSKAR